MKISVRTSKRLEEAKTILVRGTNWIGDAVMTLPAMAAIRRSFPHARISILVKPWVADIFYFCSDVDDIILYLPHKGQYNLANVSRISKEIKGKGFDAAILLQNAIEAAIIAFLGRIPIRAGYNSDARGFLLTHSVKRTRAIRRVHQVHYYLEMVRALGCTGDHKEFHFHVADQEKFLGRSLLEASGMKREGGFIGIAPGAAYGPAKRWFPERFAAVADRLIEEFSVDIGLFGSGADRETTEAISRHARHPLIDLAGATTLKDAISIMATCRLFISNDSGLMHIAGALGVPTLAIFGSTNPVATSPIGESNIIIHKDIPCSPCLKEECPEDFQCMDMITVDDVYGAAQCMLSR